jgi:hypothetical protein
MATKVAWRAGFMTECGRSPRVEVTRPKDGAAPARQETWLSGRPDPAIGEVS